MIYVASKVKHAGLWLERRANGEPIISTWIDEAGQGQTADHSDLASRCLWEISQSKALVLYCQAGEILKGALLEVGAALMAGIPVYCVGTCESLNTRTFAAHPLWHACESLNEAFAALRSPENPQASTEGAQGGQDWTCFECKGINSSTWDVCNCGAKREPAKAGAADPVIAELEQLGKWVRDMKYNRDDAPDEIARAIENRVRQLRGCPTTPIRPSCEAGKTRPSRRLPASPA